MTAPTHDQAAAKLTEMVHSRGIADADALLADRSVTASLRLLWGDADEVGEQVAELLATGLDGVVVNMPADGHDPDAVAFAGETLVKAMPG